MGFTVSPENPMKRFTHRTVPFEISPVYSRMNPNVCEKVMQENFTALPIEGHDVDGSRWRQQYFEEVPRWNADEV